MTLPRGFNKPNKKDLEDKIKLLEEKLASLNSLLSDKVTPYHIHEEQIKDENSVKELDEAIERKIKEIRGKDESVPKGVGSKLKKQKETPKKGIKIQTLLVFSAIFVTTFCASMYFLYFSHQDQMTATIPPIEQPSSPYTDPVIESKSAQCQKAYLLGPNEWYKKNCM